MHDYSSIIPFNARMVGGRPPLTVALAVKRRGHNCAASVWRYCIRTDDRMLHAVQNMESGMSSTTSQQLSQPTGSAQDDWSRRYPQLVVLNNPHTRLPFEGVAAFYQALRKGPGGEQGGAGPGGRHSRSGDTRGRSRPDPARCSGRHPRGEAQGRTGTHDRRPVADRWSGHERLRQPERLVEPIGGCTYTTGDTDGHEYPPHTPTNRTDR